MKLVRLYLLGANEIFGLDEVIEAEPRRTTTVICQVNNSVVYYIKKEDFTNCVNLYKFNEKI